MIDLSIIVPVFNAIDEVADCLLSILDSDAATSEIILINDGSDGGVDEVLKSFSDKHKNIKVITNFRNRGYTRSINQGVRSAGCKHVCVLNSDTLVPKVWVAPLVSVLEGSKDICAVGPLSNAASYQSIPQVHDSNGGFSTNRSLGYCPDEREKVSKLLRDLFNGKLIDVPILNGFCTVFRKSVLLEVGNFDWDSFPQGYGEENDVCIRLKALGYRLCVVPYVFVHHQKSKSFGVARKKLLSKLGSQVLEQKFGNDLIMRATDQLENDPRMELVRSVVGSFISGSLDREGFLFRRYNVIKGPKHLELSADGALIESVEIDHYCFSLSKTCDVSINIPADADLLCPDNDARSNCLLQLALLSHFCLVLVDKWEPDLQLVSQISEINDLKFGMLFKSVMKQTRE